MILFSGEPAYCIINPWVKNSVNQVLSHKRQVKYRISYNKYQIFDCMICVASMACDDLSRRVGGEGTVLPILGELRWGLTSTIRIISHLYPAPQSPHSTPTPTLTLWLSLQLDFSTSCEIYTTISRRSCWATPSTASLSLSLFPAYTAGSARGREGERGS